MVEICSCELIEYDLKVYVDKFDYKVWQFIITSFIDHVIQLHVEL